MMQCVSVMREVRLIFLGDWVQEPWRTIKKGSDKLISRTHMLIPLLKIIGTGRVVARQLGPNIFGKLQQKPNLMRPHVSPSLADPQG